MKTITIEKVPCWAVCPIVNDDYSGLNDEDVSILENWLKKLDEDNICLRGPIEGTESEFEPYPAFGLASDTIDFSAEILNEDRRTHDAT